MTILPSSTSAGPSTPARLLPLQARQQLALDALAGQSISALAERHQVSRKFIYQQLGHAHDALDQAFAPPGPTAAVPLLVARHQTLAPAIGSRPHPHLPQFLRGVHELLADLFDYPLSLGSIHNEPAPGRRQRTPAQRPTRPRRGAASAPTTRIFQASRPVLVGADVASTYCYLLSPEEHRDADTWGVRLLELSERAALHPDACPSPISRRGLRAGQAEAWPDVALSWRRLPRLADRDAAGPLPGEPRAYDAIATYSRPRRPPGPCTEHRQGRKDASQQVNYATPREAETQALTPADEGGVARRPGCVRTCRPCVALDYARRCLLYDWIVAELQGRGKRSARTAFGLSVACWKTTATSCRPSPSNSTTILLALAEDCAVPVTVVAEVRRVLSRSANRPERWCRSRRCGNAGGQRYAVFAWAAVAELLGQVVRASSVIENLNSRLRSYFFLRAGTAQRETTWR